jgi:hypothetical protein
MERIGVTDSVFDLLYETVTGGSAVFDFVAVPDALALLIGAGAVGFDGGVRVVARQLLRVPQGARARALWRRRGLFAAVGRSVCDNRTLLCFFRD